MKGKVPPSWTNPSDGRYPSEQHTAAHTEIGELARAHGVERLYAMGGLAKLAVDSFGAGGQWFADWQALAGALAQDLGGAGAAGGGVAGSAGAAGAVGVAGAGPGAAGVRLLIKGSRVNRLERVVDTLVHGSTQQTGGH